MFFSSVYVDKRGGDTIKPKSSTTNNNNKKNNNQRMACTHFASSVVFNYDYWMESSA